MKTVGAGRTNFAPGILLLLALLAGGVANATRAGDGWVVAHRSLGKRDLNAVYFVDTRRGWVAGDGGLILHTEDGGVTWAQQSIPTADSINDLYFRDKENGFLLAGSRIFSTHDSGATWIESRHFLSTDFGGGTLELYSVRFATKKKGWVVGSISRRDTVIDSLVLFTNDGGASWQRQIVPTRRELIHLDFANDKRGWIVGDSGVVLHTRDGGAEWVAQRTDTKAALYHVNFRNDEVGWAVGAGGTIIRTVDGGDSWITVHEPGLLRATLLSVRFVNDDEGWIVGRSGVILRSDDGGRTWIRQESQTTQNLFALFIDKKRCWAVGTGGLILRYDR